MIRLNSVAQTNRTKSPFDCHANKITFVKRMNQMKSKVQIENKIHEEIKKNVKEKTKTK